MDSNVTMTVEDQILITLEEMEKEHIIKALIHTKWNITLAARLINVARSTMYRLIKKHGIKREQI